MQSLEIYSIYRVLHFLKEGLNHFRTILNRLTNKVNSFPQKKINAFYEVIAKFNEAQRVCCEILAREWQVSLPITNNHWSALPLDETVTKSVFEKHNIKVFPHGYGLTMTTNEFTIDFDFGDNGEANGFDPGRLERFNQDNKITKVIKEYHEFENVLKSELAKGNLVYSGYINYYRKD